MGCTSSAPNMPDVTTDTSASAENDTSDVVKDVKEDNYYAKHDAVESDLNAETISNVLPTCDRLDIHLDRNSASLTNIHNEEEKQDIPTTNVVENEEISEDECDENKFSTLKEVADQVILNNILEEIAQTSTQHHESRNNEEEIASVFTEDKSQDLLEECGDEKLDEAEDPVVEESSSPSQSQGSRSTRWEALADIAAELPPSLAVDPMTGQIYSLTK